jgi:hypothetical protein
MKIEEAAIKILKEFNKREWIKDSDLRMVLIGKNDFGVVISFLENNKLVNKRRQKYSRDISNAKIFIENYHKEKSKDEITKIVAFAGSIIALTGVYNFFCISKLWSDYIIQINYIFFFLVFSCFAPFIIYVFKFYKNIKN